MNQHHLMKFTIRQMEREANNQLKNKWNEPDSEFSQNSIQRLISDFCTKILLKRGMNKS
jgi:ribosome recycling factor